jgi:uncharacterized protein (TIGR03067 family)
MPQRFLFLGILVCSLGLLGCSRSDNSIIQGVWIESGGDNAEIKFVGSNVQIAFPGQPKVEKGTFKLDPTKNPKHIDFQSSEGEYTRAIYELDGDNLRWYSNGREPLTRPTRFPESEADKSDMTILKRK